MFLVVGCGLSGAVVAERIANVLKRPVLIIEKSDHIGGLCYDYVDEKTGILVNKYGPHLFHTNNERVWNYVNTFCTWKRWDHRVISFVDNKYVPMPINITTVNMICNTNIATPEEMQNWLSNNQVYTSNIMNSEDVALSRIGTECYEKLIKEYTFKQWAKYPKDLHKEVLQRIPVRDNFDTRYFSDKYQALPEKGYTHFISNMLNNPLITCMLNTNFNTFRKAHDMNEYEAIIYTGPIDRYFEDTGMQKLEYRSIEFIEEVHYNTRYYQQNAVVNYPEKSYPFTRITEYKHFLNQKSDHTIIFKEITNDHGDPYYPVPTQKNKDLYEQYKQLADQETKVHFIGRLANYKYFNMDEAIHNSLLLFDKISHNNFCP